MSRLAFLVFPTIALTLFGIINPEPAPSQSPAAKADYRLAVFSADVTCPIGHPLLAGLIPPAKQIVDPLYARGLVLLGAGQPIVVCAVDWCEIRNQSYENWRAALAQAAGTTPERILLTSVHQHDTPVTDIGAEKLLAEVGLGGKMFDVEFEKKCIERTAAALKKSLKEARKLAYIGIGAAKVKQIASNRRVVLADGKVTYGRGSNSGGDKVFRDAPEGEIDPWLRTITLFDDEKKLVAALHSYATHPMSYYRQGGVSADFVGMARDLVQKEYPNTFHIYASGCSGDVTAGKYNDGAPANRPLLAQRLSQAMVASLKVTGYQEVGKIAFRSTKLDLEFRKTPAYSQQALKKVLADKAAAPRDRILAAMGLSSLQRVSSGLKIDFPCLDLGRAQIILYPGEAFVSYQLAAQEQRQNPFVMCLGYGECWPGYIPGAKGFQDNFDDMWFWVAPGAEKRIQTALDQVLPRKK